MLSLALDVLVWVQWRKPDRLYDAWQFVEHRKDDVKELKANASCQSKRYNELWSSHRELLMETQALHSQVSILSSSSRADRVVGWLESISCESLVPSNRTRSASRQSERLSDRAESSGGQPERSRGWSESQGSGGRRN